MDINHFDADFPKAVLRALQDLARVETVGGTEKILRRSFDKFRNLLRARSLSLSKGRPAVDS